MSNETSIEWADATFNPWIGCTKVSPGCKNCYAERTGARLNVVWGAVAPRRIASDTYWREPLRWNRAAAKSGVRRRVFCASLADVFEDREDLRLPRARLWRLIEATPHLDWLLLTKRPENADKLAAGASADCFGDGEDMPPVWPRNVWLGTTVEDQARADERIPHLLRTPASVRFLSCEPLLERVVLPCTCGEDPLGHHRACPWNMLGRTRGIDWVIVGGESGPGARRFDVEWARSLVKQCRAAKVPVFVKQMGAFVVDRNDAGFEAENEVLAEGPSAGRPVRPTAWPTPMDVEHDIDGYREVYQGAPVRIRLANKKGNNPIEWPEDLRVRELPEATR